MGIIKKPYEISVWEDKIQYVGTDGNVYNNISEMSIPIDYQYYTENRLATIGSDKMTSQTRVINPILTRNINGTETLKFDIYYQFIDNITGEETHNPLVDLLVNERKIKLYYDDDDPNHPDHWYDFIIKKDEERARDNKYSFTCTSLAANELGKTGFKIELDTELENNMGTVQELGEKVLEGSDWQLAAQGQATLQQTINEPLYKILTNTSFTANLRVPKNENQNTKEIPNGKYIYVYYTPYAQKETDYFQFIYIEDNATITTLTDGITLVCDDENVWDLYLTNVEWVDDKPSFEYIGYYQTVVSEAAFNSNPTNYYIYDQETQKYVQCTYDSTYDSEETYYIKGDVAMAQYRGDRYVRKQKTTYDSTLKKTVKIYTDNSDPAQTVYGYQTTRYYDVNSIYNYIHNSTNFGSTSYWTAFSNGEVNSTIDRVIYPSVQANNIEEERKNYLSVYIGNDGYENVGGLPSDFSTGYSKYYYLENNEYIQCTANDTDKQTYYLKQRSRIMNNGIVYNYSKINTFDRGETYIFRVKVKGYDKDNDILSGYLNTSSNFPFTCQVRKYIKIDKYTEDDQRYFNFLGSNTQPDYDLVKDLTEEQFEGNKTNYYTYNNGVFTQCTNESVFNIDTNYFVLNGYALITADCERGASWSDLKENLGIFLFRSERYGVGVNYTSYFVEDIQLYKAIPREEGGYYTIGDVPEVKFETVDHYYYPDENGSFTNPDDYTYITDNQIVLTPVYGSGAQEFEKIRSLSKKESNRFNLLQELCETFECWVKFNITHESNGQINIEDYIYYNPVTECPNLIKSEYYNEAPWDNAIIDTEEYKGKKAIIIQAKTLYQETDRGTTCIFPSITFEENTQYTISLDWCDHIRTDGNSTRIRIKFDYTDGTSNNIVSPNNSSTADWVHRIFTSTAGKTIDAITVSYGSSGVVSISNFKIEKGINEINYYYYDHLTNQYILTTDNLNNIQYYEALTRKRQNKKVIFYGEILEDNPIGFKYGINLKDVTRTLDSDQIATKIIVKNNSCEQAENGFCSIARARDNPTKENFLYNFDYYVKQRILDQSTLYNDLYLEINGSIGLYPKLARYNSKRNDLISRFAELATSIMQLTSKTQEALLRYNSANEELQKLIDPISGKLYKYSNYIYEDFFNQVQRQIDQTSININNIWIPACQNQIYYLKKGTNLINITRKNRDGSDNGHPRYFYKVIVFPESIKGSAIINTYSSDVNGDKFNGWNALRYYYIEGRYYERCKKNEKIVDDRDYYRLGYVNKTPFFINSSNSFEHTEKYAMPNNGTTYYWCFDRNCRNDEYDGDDLPKIRTNNGEGCYQNELYFQVSDEIITFTLSNEISIIPEVYVYGAYKRIEQASADDTVNDTKTIDYIAQIQTLQKTVNDSNIEYETQKVNLDETQEKYDQIAKELNNIAEATSEIEKEFNIKYSRYIQEGSWNDDNYMDDDLYYLDAVNVLYQSAYPKTSYTINVLELSALEGYEAYRFQLAHKTFVEDTEFFGWIDYANKIPAHENVVVTELTTAFDEPDKNTIKVQNYKSHFEDLFQRITSATQNLEYHSGDYKRASDAIQSNGTIQQSIFQDTLTKAAYIISNANNQSVIINETGLTATKTNAPAEVVKLTSGGILLTNDGENWSVAISADGINTERLSAGTINTENITIMNSNKPTFKWDSNGLKAFSFTENNNEITSYNINNYVNFDRFGIYGINGISNFAPKTVAEVEKKANFALTWNGLFIRSNYRSGYVSISPTDDITLYSYSNNNFNKIPPIVEYEEVETNSDDFEINKANYYYIEDEEYKSCRNENYDENKTYYKVAKKTPGVDENYYYNNRRAFYIKQDEYIINCVDEMYNEIPDYILYTQDYVMVDKPTSGQWESETKTDYYYLDKGKYLQCDADLPYDLLPDIVFKISDESNNILATTPIQRAKFGMLAHLNSGEEIFGLALYDLDGNPTVTTQSNGTLWLQNSMRIGTEDQINEIYIGVGEIEEIDGVERYKVIKVEGLSYDENLNLYRDENFVVYSDGTLNAKKAIIEGEIQATSGWIGSENSGAQIDEYGIHIKDGGFDIKVNDNQVLYFDDNNLVFNGTIIVSRGSIGGFEIGENTISSTNLILTSAHDDIESSIYVENIDIGTGANITDYLQISNLKLLNPSKNDNYVIKLQIGNSKKVTKDLEPIVGKKYYTLDENNQYILFTGSSFDQSTTYYEDDIKFSLDNSGNLVATNANITGTIHATDGDFTGTIHASEGEFSGSITAATINATTINTINFVTEKIRSMGGAFIFKPTFECKSIEINGQNIIVELDNSKENNSDFSQFSLYDIVSFTDSKAQNGVLVGKVTAINLTDSKITITTSANIPNNFNPTTITWFGQTAEDIIIGINSDSNDAGGLLKSKSLTINSFNYTNNNLSIGVKLLLGDLRGAKDASGNQLSGYGLYADNVYLHGSLITQTGNDSSYAGVNTQKNQRFSYNRWTDPNKENYDDDTKYTNDKIIFWGGAQNLDPDSITKSPFVVTDKGNIFARNGEFKGTVITDSIVSNSTIKAATIEGTGSSPSLKIYDTGNGGISFYKKDNTNNETNDIETLRISNDGIYCYSYQGISNPIIGFSENNNNVIFRPTLIKINTTEISQGEFKDNNKISIVSIQSEIENNASTNITNIATIIKMQSQLEGSNSKNISYQQKDNYYCLFVE